MSPSVKATLAQLEQLPMARRLTLLAMAIIEDDPRAETAVASLVAVAAIMASELLPVQRAAIAVLMRNEAATPGELLH
jgi:hypothetical protein